MLVIGVLALLVSLPGAAAQAPGDHDPVCRAGPHFSNHIFPAEWKILMDTHDYVNLYDPFALPHPVWTHNDVDGDLQGWTQIAGGNCGWFLYSCTYSTLPQNNWLFSQFISYLDANEVFFNTTFTFSECVSAPSCNRSHVTLYGYNRDTVASHADRINPNNYQPLFGTVESSQLKQLLANNAENSTNETRSLARQDGSNGFYLGVRDEGTCGSVVRLVVYYLVCPARGEGLVSYAEFALPVRGSSDIKYNASCADNAHNVTTLEVVASSETASCYPVAPAGPVCECNAGYILAGDRRSCQACAVGTYHSPNDLCQPCPANTITSEVAVTECSCISGFYRSISQFEGPEFNCTKPPTACTGLHVVATTGNSLTITWSRPVTTGRRDYFYRIFHSDPSNSSEFIMVNDSLVNTGSTVTYKVMGLLPVTSYLVWITTHNGVTDQDPEHDHLRRCEVSTATTEGVPGLPGNVQGLCEVVVWRAPDQLGGATLTGYDILFSSDPSSVTRLNASTQWFITEGWHKEPSVTVQVRAVNDVGEGVYSLPQPVCPYSPVSKATCQPCEPDARISSQNSTSFTIEWAHHSFNENTSYHIALSDPDESGVFQSVEGNISGTGTRLVYTLTGLKPFTPYLVKLTASNGNGEICHITSQIKTAEGVPSPPSGPVRFGNLVLWQSPDEPNGIITGYEMKFSSHWSRTKTEWIQSFGPEVNHYALSEKETAAHLVIQIRASTRAGHGMWTVSISISIASNGLFTGPNEVELAIVAMSVLYQLLFVC